MTNQEPASLLFNRDIAVQFSILAIAPAIPSGQAADDRPYCVSDKIDKKPMLRAYRTQAGGLRRENPI